ncbi:histidine kinase [Phytohabitans sp. LJ34]|uniref:sensor histidine kinase n=1 Tax=Phytohabitans sp. LJ34 TaxID=3452217 RepID=UPI003F89074D
MGKRVVGAVVGLLVVAATAVAAVVTVGTYVSGFRYGANAPVFAVPLAVGVLVTAGGAGWLFGQGERRVGWWLAGTAGSLLLYLVLAAAAADYAGVRGHRDALAHLLVFAVGLAYAPPITLLQLTFLAAVDRIDGGSARRRRFGVAALWYVAVYTGLGVATGFEDPAYPGLHAGPLAALAPLGWVLSVPWMASVLLGPVVAWRSLPRQRGERRFRLLLVAVLSIVPILTIVFCVLSGLLAYAFGVLSTSAGESGLSVAFCLPFALCAPGLVLALRPGELWRVQRMTPAVASTVLTVVMGVLFAIVVVSLSAILGAQFGPGALLPVVLATLAVAAVFAPLRRRLVRLLVLRADPVRARAAVLVREAGADARVRPAHTAEQILRQALGDPTARLVLRLPDGHGWVDVDTAPTDPPVAESLTWVPGGDGGPHAAVAHTMPAVDAAGAVAELGPLIDQAVLEVAVRDQARRIAVERERADEAAATERRRLERDLHDGVQGRLLALALELRMAQRELGDGAAQLVLSDAVDGLTTAIEELRTLAAGATPELLSRRGLHAALVDLSQRIPVPVTLNVHSGRLPPPVETVAYLVICEAVTNALKHSAAAAITVGVAVEDGAAAVTVTDDGRGGADIRAGTGLRGLAERVGAAGGRLVVSDARPRGTTVEVILPCVW